MDAVWVGLDLGRAKTDFCVVDEDGMPIHEGRRDTELTQIAEQLSAFENIGLIAVEASSEIHLVRSLRADSHRLKSAR